MKKIYLILIILISFNFSNQFTKLPNKIVTMVKCFFGSAENINVLTSFVDTIFSSNSSLQFLISLMNLANVVNVCTGIDLLKLIQIFSGFAKVQNKKEIVLNKLQDAKAPILLRKYLYDTALKEDLTKAKRECDEMTNMTPYEEYKNICDLF